MKIDQKTRLYSFRNQSGMDRHGRERVYNASKPHVWVVAVHLCLALVGSPCSCGAFRTIKLPKKSQNGSICAKTVFPKCLIQHVHAGKVHFWHKNALCQPVSPTSFFECRVGGWLSIAGLRRLPVWVHRKECQEPSARFQGWRTRGREYGTHSSDGQYPNS